MTIEETLARIDELQATIDELDARPVDRLSAPELIDLIREWDLAAREVHDYQLRMIGQLRRSAPPVALGGTPFASILSKHLRISEDNARERIEELIALGYG